MIRYVTLICLLATFTANAQKLSPYFGLNGSSHWIQSSQTDSRYAYGFRSGIQGGLNYTHQLNRIVQLSYRAEYVQKGYESRNNTLHYVGLQQQVQFTPFPNKLKNAYAAIGATNHRLVKESLIDQIEDYDGTQAIIPGDYNKWSLGGVLAVGYWIDRLNLEGGMNFDIAPSIVYNQFEVRNYLWYFNVGFQVF